MFFLRLFNTDLSRSVLIPFDMHLCDFFPRAQRAVKKWACFSSRWGKLHTFDFVAKVSVLVSAAMSLE